MKKRTILFFLAAALLLSALIAFTSCSEVDGTAAAERLKQVIDSFVQPDRYTSESYAVYKSAYDEAVELSKSSNLTAIAADRAIDKVNSAKKALILKNDFSELKSQLDFYLTVKKENYTKASYQAYTEAYEHGSAVLAVDSSTQSEINSAAKRLDDAKKSLEELPDTTALRTLLARSVDGSLYTQSSYAAYKEAVNKGTALLMQECPSLTELKIAENMLNEAYASLVPLGNGDHLAELTASVRAILVSDSSGRAPKDHFAKKGYEATVKALNDAEALLKNGDASAKMILDAENALNGAYAILVDISSLFDAYDEGGKYSATIVSGKYTDESYRRLSAAMENVYTLMNKADVTSGEVSQAVENLYKVISKMERRMVEPDGLKDKELSSLNVRVGVSATTLGDYKNDFTVFFRSILTSNPDFAYNVEGDAVVFTKGNVKASLSESLLRIDYSGPAQFSEKDLASVSFGGVKLNDKPTLLVSPEGFGVPTGYEVVSTSLSGVVKEIAVLTYENEEDGIKLVLSYNMRDEYIVSFEVSFSPAVQETP